MPHLTGTSFYSIDARYTTIISLLHEPFSEIEGNENLGHKSLILDHTFDEITGLSRYNLEQRFINRDNVLYGSHDGASMRARLFDGDDEVRVFSGDHNFINGNKGNDHFAVNGGGGKILGGADNDSFTMRTSNYFSSINGNEGNDTFYNLADYQDMVRGGQGDDVFYLTRGRMNAYGDKGADKFVPQTRHGRGFMVVKDFEAGVDQIDVSNYPGYKTTVTPDGLLFSDNRDRDFMLLEGLESIF